MKTIMRKKYQTVVSQSDDSLYEINLRVLIYTLGGSVRVKSQKNLLRADLEQSQGGKPGKFDPESRGLAIWPCNTYVGGAYRK